MLQLLKIEWLKIKKYPAFWWMLGIVALTYPGINWFGYKLYEGTVSRHDMAGALAKSLLGNPFAFPESWHSVAYFSSFFVIIPAILVIMVITNEYNYKTHRQNVIDGWSRTEFVTSKILDVFIVTLVVTLMYLLTAGISGFMLQEGNQSNWTDQIKYVPLFMLQTFAQLSIAFMLGFLVRKAFIALGIFLFYYLIVEPTLRGLLTYFKMPDLANYLPFNISNKLIPYPQFLKRLDEDAYSKALDLINMHVIYTLLLTSALWWLCYSVYKKRDL